MIKSKILKVFFSINPYSLDTFQIEYWLLKKILVIIKILINSFAMFRAYITNFKQIINTIFSWIKFNKSTKNKQMKS